MTARPLTGPEFGLVIADGTTWLGEVDTYESATITARYNDVSTWELVVPSASNAAVLLTEAARPRLIVTAEPGVVFRSGPVTRPERVVDSDGDMLTVSGVDDLIWLRRRVVHPQPGTAAPPYSSSAFDTWTGSASQVIAGFVDRNAGPSAHEAWRVPGLTVPTPAAMGPTVKASGRYQNLLDFVVRMANRAGLGVEIRDLVFTVTEPTGPAAVFSQELGTLAGWSHAIQSPDVNHVYVAGGGAGAARLIREYSDAASVMAWGRVEGFTDRRDTTDTAELDEAGAETLADGIPPPELELAALDTSSQQFLVDWQLGDRATVSFDGQQITDTIREVTIDLTANTPPLVTPTIGGRA